MRTIGPALSSQTAESFFAYVKSLYKAPESNNTQSKLVPNISLNFSNKKVIVKIAGEKKITDEQLDLLVQEYLKTKEELIELFVKRKITIVSAEGTPLYAKPKRTRNKKTKEDVATAQGRTEVLC